MFGGVGFPPPDVFIIGDQGTLYTPTVPLVQLSHTIHEFMNRSIIFFFSLISATVNCIRKRFLLKHRRGSFYVFSIISHLDKIFDVRVRNGHQFSMVIE